MTCRLAAALVLILCGLTAAAPVRLAATGGARPFVGAVVAGGADGAAAWWQPNGDDGGRLWAWPKDADAAAATTISCGDVARTLGATAADGPGVVAGLALDGRDAVVLWRGKVDGRTTAAVVRVENLVGGDGPRVTLRVEVDPRTMLDALDLGDSLVLVDLTLLRSGGELYVLARDLDRVRLLRRSLGGYGLGTRLDLRVGGGGADDPPPDLRRPDVRLAAGPDDGLLATWTDAAGVTRVWRIDREGAAVPLARLDGLPLGHTPAAGSNAGVWLFAADTAAPRPLGPTEPLGDGGRPNFPALLRLDPATGSVTQAVGRDDFAAPPDLAVYALNPASLVPAGPRRLVCFDPLTGAILRVDLDAP